MSRRDRVRELIVVFGTLGVIGFGGPAAHIALMRREVVERRGWLTDQQMVDLVGITNLIPGPNSTEMAMHVGRLRARRVGLVVAGLAFILPAAAIVLALAWAYVTYGDTPAGEALLYGVKPVIIAIVGGALIAFARTALSGPLRVVVALAAAGLWLAGVNELVLLAGGAISVAVLRLGTRHPWTAVGLVMPFAAVSAATSVNLVTLGAVFLKAGALLYGSGYVLLAFLRGDLVERLGWLTDAQLLDAVAIGQVTPGPLFTTATFVGYLLAGIPGAVVATIAIFLPAFVFVAIIGPLAERLRDRPLTAALLDGVNAAALGLMAAVSVQLGASDPRPADGRAGSRRRRGPVVGPGAIGPARGSWRGGRPGNGGRWHRSLTQLSRIAEAALRPVGEAHPVNVCPPSSCGGRSMRRRTIEHQATDAVARPGRHVRARRLRHHSGGV